MKIRLNKFLAESGCCSRRKADDFIQEGLVEVNGQKVTSLGLQIDPKLDEVTLLGTHIKPIAHPLVYYAFYKPKGIISTASDEQNRKKVTDFLPSTPRVYPVGRLDADSEGLMILTNDGNLTQMLTHPSFEHEKEYEVTITTNHKINPKQIERDFTKGMLIDDQWMKAKSARLSKPSCTNGASKEYHYMINTVLTTGYNRQIRKMCSKVGLKVIKLVRVRIGRLSLTRLNLKPGEYILILKSDII
jgi:23S rRNA pseudouridine2605 synthase